MNFCNFATSIINNSNMNQAMHRRLKSHDYNGRGIYMLTFSTAGRTPVLGSLVHEEGDFRIVLTELGKHVAEEIQALAIRYPQIKVLDYVVMPDHVHILLFVREQMPQHLGRVVASLKAKCSQAWWQRQEETSTLKRTAQNECSTANGQPRPESGAQPPRLVGGTSVPPPLSPRKPSLWEPGYHDRYLMHQGQLQTLHNYIHDNPKRLGIKRMRPDLFRVRQHLCIGEQEYASMGNIFLLKSAEKHQVFMHRNATEGEILQETDRLMACCERGAVLVTPGISPGEKAIVHAAIEQGMPLILLRENGFAEYEKPHGRYFEACAAGTLLLLSPWEHHTDRRTISRSQCLSLNDMARSICEDNTTFVMME